VTDELESLITADMRACFGSETGWLELPEEFSASDVRHFVSVIGETNPIYRDDEYAKSMGYKGRVVPPLFVVIAFRRLQQDENGARPGLEWPGFKLPEQFRNTRNAGQVYHWFAPVYVGDRLSIKFRLKDVLAKRTRTGTPMLLVVSEVEMRNQRGDLVLRQVNHDAKLPLTSYKAS
jgi:acyl dehydratase